MMEWQPIETAPKTDLLLVYCPGDVEDCYQTLGYRLAYFDDGYEKWMQDEPFEEVPNPPSHWALLPEPPEDD
jgi:hypothetical protein